MIYQIIFPIFFTPCKRIILSPTGAKAGIIHNTANTKSIDPAIKDLLIVNNFVFLLKLINFFKNQLLYYFH